MSSDTLRWLQEEVERLRRENADLAAGWQRTYDHDCNLMKAKIERLRGIIDDVLTIAKKWPNDPVSSIIDPIREALGDGPT